MIEDGRVKLDGQIVLKPARQMDPAQAIVVEESDDPEYVSRGAHKLAGALDALGDKAPLIEGVGLWMLALRRVGSPTCCYGGAQRPCRRRRRVWPARVEAAERPAGRGTRPDERAYSRPRFRRSGS